MREPESGSVDITGFVQLQTRGFDAGEKSLTSSTRFMNASPCKMQSPANTRSLRHLLGNTSNLSQKSCKTQAICLRSLIGIQYCVVYLRRPIGRRRECDPEQTEQTAGRTY